LSIGNWEWRFLHTADIRDWKLFPPIVNVLGIFRLIGRYKRIAAALLAELGHQSAFIRRPCASLGEKKYKLLPGVDADAVESFAMEAGRKGLA
jgi:hypothetical protein